MFRQCQYDGPYKKPTKLIMWNFQSSLLAKQCTGSVGTCSYTGRANETLSGIDPASGEFKTAKASPYPHKFADTFARELSKKGIDRSWYLHLIHLDLTRLVFFVSLYPSVAAPANAIGDPYCHRRHNLQSWMRSIPILPRPCILAGGTGGDYGRRASQEILSQLAPRKRVGGDYGLR